MGDGVVADQPGGQQGPEVGLAALGRRRQELWVTFHGAIGPTQQRADLVRGATVRHHVDHVAAVAVTVTNTGGREGSEVVQVYVGALPVPVKTPERQLASFAKVRLAPGASQRVEVAVPRRAVSYFDADAHDWASASGEVALLVGASSNDIRLSGSVAV